MSEEKLVKLTPDQLKDIKHAFHSTRICHKVLSDIVLELTEKLAKAEVEVWEDVYMLSDDVTEETHRAQIRYLTSEVVFTPRRESDI